MDTFIGWEALYKELAEKVNTNLPEIAWVDLWHNQVGFLVEEHPFPTPALFIAFRITGAENLSEKVQDANIQIDLYYFYETLADTNVGSYNQESALEYLETLTKLHRLFHASSGVNFSELSRVGFAAVDTGSSGNLYRISFSGKVVDETAAIAFDKVIPGGTNLEIGIKVPNDQGGDYQIPNP